jgi:hypothetical protein
MQAAKPQGVYTQAPPSYQEEGELMTASQACLAFGVGEAKT